MRHALLILLLMVLVAAANPDGYFTGLMGARLRLATATPELWTPVELGTNVVAWWDSTTGVYADVNGVTNATVGSRVMRWNTRYGSISTATNNVFTNSPTINTILVPAGGVYFGGNSGLFIDRAGADQSSVENVFSAHSGYFLLNSGYAVAFWDGSASGWGTLFNTSVKYRAVITRTSDGTPYAEIDYATNDADINHVLHWSVNGATNSVWSTGTQGTVNTSGPTVRGYWKYFGMRDAANMNHTHQRHVLIVKGALSTSDRQKIEGWAAHSIGAQGKLPADHPYKSAAPYK